MISFLQLLAQVFPFPLQALPFLSAVVQPSSCRQRRLISVTACASQNVPATTESSVCTSYKTKKKQKDERRSTWQKNTRLVKHTCNVYIYAHTLYMYMYAWHMKLSTIYPKISYTCESTDRVARQNHHNSCHAYISL